MLKDDAKACAAGALEVGDYLVGQDPSRVVLPLAGHSSRRLLSRRPDQDRDLERHRSGAVGHQGQGVRRARSTSCSAARPATGSACTGPSAPTTGVNAMKVAPRHRSAPPFKYVEGQKFVDEVVERFKALREKHGSGVDIGVDFHGAVQPPTASLLMKALEPYHPWFYEEVVQALNVDVMAELARKTHIPLATGERIFTKWGFREILEKRAAIDSAAGRLLCRRHHGTATDRGHGGGVLRAARAAQSAGAVLAGGQPADRRVDSELPDPGARRQRTHQPAGEAAAAGQERPSRAADRSRAGDHDRRGQAEGAWLANRDRICRGTTPTTVRSSTGSG